MQELLNKDTSQEFDKFHREVEELKDIWDSYHQLLINYKASEEEIKKKNIELKELNESKDKFFSIIAHDLRSPFQGLLGMSNFMIEEFESLSKEEFREMALSLNEALHSQYKFLDDLLSWSRIQSGRMVFEPEELNVKSEVEKVIKLFDTNINNKKIEIITNINSNLYVIADNDMLLLLLRNLISNAIKFSNTNGIIEITAFREDEMIFFVISDNGVGIAEENIAKLFRIDVQFSTYGTAKESGNGLGLVLCKEIAEKHNGSIWVERCINQGTQFYFSLPARSELS